MITNTIAAFVVGAAVLVAGSAVALRTMGTQTAAFGESNGIRFVQGFSADRQDAVWNCSANDVVLTHVGEWNGEWAPANNDFTQFAWASCTNHWAFGHINGAKDKAGDMASIEGVVPSAVQ